MAATETTQHGNIAITASTEIALSDILPSDETLSPTSTHAAPIPRKGISRRKCTTKIVAVLSILVLVVVAVTAVVIVAVVKSASSIAGAAQLGTFILDIASWVARLCRVWQAEDL
jgi:hypothetical protein